MWKQEVGLARARLGEDLMLAAGVVYKQSTQQSVSRNSDR